MIHNQGQEESTCIKFSGNQVFVDVVSHGHSCVASRSCLALVITAAVAVAALTVLTALVIATYMPTEQDSYKQTTWTDPSFTGETTDDVTQHVDFTSSPHTSTEELKQTAIVFGGEGEEPGQLFVPYGVVVSPSNEIFVADTYNRRVQVFSMTGVYLRHFPTIVPGEASGTIEPEYISIDGEGHLWVAGDENETTGFIVRYTKLGRHLATLHPTFKNNSFCGIAVDALRNLVAVTEFWSDYGELKILHFNGTVVRKFRTEWGPEYPGRVAVGREGNLFVNNHWGGTSVYVYNSTGHYLFSFGGDKIGEVQTTLDDGPRVVVVGICTDSSGNVLLSTGPGGTVELFTAGGRYVRRAAAGMFRADGVAVGPSGQLVVTDDTNSTVTVFSHY
ncbi:tripartite motif-containing protein 3-like [Branchiostoma lanceolatum]|uniref:tripartite motif-containing protein 3-like n=1 Tax=Branchiostoma lanceolatum TaxID=7740 RepID=UPI003451E3AF